MIKTPTLVLIVYKYPQNPILMTKTPTLGGVQGLLGVQEVFQPTAWGFWDSAANDGMRKSGFTA